MRYSILSTHLEPLSSPWLIWVGLAWNLKEKAEEDSHFPLLTYYLTSSTEQPSEGSGTNTVVSIDKVRILRFGEVNQPLSQVPWLEVMAPGRDKRRREAMWCHQKNRRMRANNAVVVMLVLELFMQNPSPHPQKQGNKTYFQDWLCLMWKNIGPPHAASGRPNTHHPHLPLATRTTLPLGYDSKSSWASSLKPVELANVILHVRNTQLTNGIRRRFNDR